MATRLENFLSHGSISNTEPGKVTGTLWFIDADEPVTLELEGNPHRDIAGTVLIFEHADPDFLEGEEVPQIDPRQVGVAGDITASKKVLYFENVLEKPDAYEPSLVNSLCIEWYNKDGERFVIDSVSFYLYAGEPEWRMDDATEQAQLEANTERFHRYIEGIASRIDDEGESQLDSVDESPLNEFEWEERLKESDRITLAYKEALDKYQDLPDQEKLVAAAMGWSLNADADIDVDIDWDTEDTDDDESEGEFQDGPFGADDEFAEEAWINPYDLRSDDHPLYERAHEFSVRLHREAQDLDLLDDQGDEQSEASASVQTLVFSTMDLSAKLAGALNGLATDTDPEPGLIIAWLKRGLPILVHALGAADSASMQENAPREWIEGARQELFGLRTAMLDLIQEFRDQLP